MKLFLVATHYDGYMNILLNKCKKEGLDYQILGLGEKWKGYAWKFNLVYDYLTTVPDDEIVIFTDAYDVIFLRDVDTITKRFRDYQTHILFSVEDVPKYIHGYLYRKMFPKVLDQHYVNSGCYMGYAYALRELFFRLKTQYNLQDTDDDQQILGKFLNSNPDFFFKYCKFDKDAKLFYNTLNKPYPSHKLSNLDSCFVHGPGNSNLGNIIRYYRLEGEEIAKKRNMITYYKNILKNYTRYFKIEAIVVLIILIIIIVYSCNKKKLKNCKN